MAINGMRFIKRDLAAFIRALPESTSCADIAEWYSDKTAVYVSVNQVKWLRARMLKGLE